MAPPGALARTMVSLRSQKRTGRLRVVAEGTPTFVYLKGGVPIFAEEGSSGETLGRLLVRLKMLTHEQYLEVLSAMTDALVFNEQIRFGETAVELGFLTEETVHRALGDQVRWKVIRCFQRDEVEWTFEDGESFIDDVGDFPMALEMLVYEAMLWLDQPRRAELGLADALDKFVLMPAATRDHFGLRLGIGAEAVPLFLLMDGARTMRELSARSFGDALGVEAALTMVVMLGAAKLSPTPCVEAVAEAVRRPAPAPAPAPPSTFPKLDRTRASNVLKRLDSVIRSFNADDTDLFKSPRSEHERRLLAEQAYQRGRAHFAAERAAAAHRAFSRAVQLEPENAEYVLLAELSEVGERIDSDPKILDRLKATALRAARRDPNLAFAYYVFGRCAFAADDLVTSVRFFKRALSLDRCFAAAERHLRIAMKRLEPA